jgi:hypothetical protein
MAGPTYIGTANANPASNAVTGLASFNNGVTSMFSGANQTLWIGGGTVNLVGFYNGAGTNTQVGSITTNGTTTAFNTTSDYRLKSTFGAASVGAIIDGIPVYDAEFIGQPETRRPMMLAHEIAVFLPAVVRGDKDAPAMQQVDYQAIVPTLLAELQALRKRVAALETR